MVRLTRRAMRFAQLDAKIDELFAIHCAGIRVPAMAIQPVRSKALLLLIDGVAEAEIGAAMCQEARDAATALSGHHG